MKIRLSNLSSQNYYIIITTKRKKFGLEPSFELETPLEFLFLKLIISVSYSYFIGKLFKIAPL